MNKFTISMLAIATGCAFGSGALAQGKASSGVPPVISADDYEKGKEKIASDYEKSKKDCAKVTGNAAEVCAADAKGKESVARAELEFRYKPSMQTQYNLSIAKAEADYAVARENCDDLNGKAKEACLKDAKATETSARNAAKASAEVVATDKAADTRRDAATDKAQAQYGVAVERCNIQFGEAREKCLADAKSRYGK